MLFWTGIGWVVAAVIFGSLLASEVLVEWATGDEQYYQTHGWPKLAGFLVAALILRMIVAKRGETGTAIDQETGEEVSGERFDTLFLIRLKYWPKIAVVLGAIFSFIRDRS